MIRSSQAKTPQALTVSDEVEQHLQYDTLFDHAEDIILYTNLDGTILRINRAVESILR